MEEVSVFFVSLELGELFFDVVGGMEKKTCVGLGEHCGVVKRISGGGDEIIEAF